MRYRVVYGNGESEEINNKQKAIKWAHEFRGRARVELVEDGSIIYENKAARESRKNKEILRQLADKIKSGIRIEDLLELRGRF